MLIIPAIDILNNKAVRLLRGNYEQPTVYYEDAAEPALLFAKNRFKRIHIVDLEASRTGTITTLPLLQKIKNETDCILQFGGGVRNKAQIEELIAAGVDKVITGSLPVTAPHDFAAVVQQYGPESFIVAMDLLNNEVRIKGWTERTSVTAHALISRGLELGIREFLCTDISRDGTLEGPSLELYAVLVKQFPEMRLIASGGIGNISHIYDLERQQIPMAVAGKAIYEKTVSLEELKNYAG